MRKVAVFTATRAEYGLLYWLMKDIQADNDLALQLIVSGAHLSSDYGNTYQKIEQDGFFIDEKVEALPSSDNGVGIAKSMGLGAIGFADSLDRLKPDILILLGDRFELLAIAQVALVMKIPILHIHGGEVTEGAYDDAIRHAVSKMSMVHCTSTEAYRQRVIQLGESPDRVYTVGAPGLDHLKRTPLMSLNELASSLSFDLKQPYFLLTYHSATLAEEQHQNVFQAILNALENYPDYQIIMTYPNSDEGGRLLIRMIEEYAIRHVTRVCVAPSLGQQRYLSAVKYAAAVIGNSSSGIIEVPSFNIPTVNIGDRQKGRLSSGSVIHCAANYGEIIKAIELSQNVDFKSSIETEMNPYGDGRSSEKIIRILKNMELSCIKAFYDLKGVSSL
ncbi:MAG: UDP-N-acetylglucosamine 2-epimerase [Cellvibrionaceae bacterium]